LAKLQQERDQANLGNLDCDQGRMEEARKEYAEALQTYRELAQKDPETYQPGRSRFDSNQNTAQRSLWHKASSQ